MAISLVAHVAVAAAMMVSVEWRGDPPATPPPATAIEIMAVPAAPAAPPRDTPPEPERPVAKPDPAPHLPPLPVVATAADAVPAPVKAPVVPPSPPAPPPAAPAAPPLPARAVAAAPTQGQPQPGPSQAQQRWDGQLLARLERRKRYPAAAQNAGQEDVVYVRISVERSGRLAAATIARSRHFDLLDAAVLDLVRRVAPLPPLPPEIAGDVYTVTVPVDFFVAGRRR